MRQWNRSELLRRADVAAGICRQCRLCPRSCRADRSRETGFCGIGMSVRCFLEVLHFGEESELNPSHQVYFAGCNLRCEFCATEGWNLNPRHTPATDAAWLRARIRLRQEQGAATLNLLGGEPTISLPGILHLLADAPPGVCLVWNSNMYFSECAADLLAGVVDVYLADFKCWSAECAETMLGAKDYVETVRENLLFARRTADLILRHLIMPGHFECCLKPIPGWVAREMPDVKLSLRGEYMPPARAATAPSRFLTDQEQDDARRLALEINLTLVT